MRRHPPAHRKFLLVYICSLFIPLAAWPQTPTPQSRIVGRVDESALVTLPGNTHPLAQAQFDQGAAPGDLPMARMLLVLKRSDAQEAALQALLDAQQDQSSPSYHQWLTPDQFGQQFGPSDQDMQAIEAWLQSHGFQVAPNSRGRTVIEFSGTAAQVQQAFHTEIHKYAVNGETHWANASDPQIPQALSPVLEGIASLHNFAKKPAYHLGGAFSKSRTTGKVHALQPVFTFPYGTFCGPADCYFVGPYDFAAIYNLTPLWAATPTAIDGTGQNIAIIARSDVAIQDVRDFRNLFNLPAMDPIILNNGADPGLVPDDETEADLDVQWSGAVAKGATINLVVSESTETTDGVDLSVVYAVEHNIAPVVSESFLQCELFLGASGNTFENAIREQAAAQGITFLTASGDQGSAGCDYVTSNSPTPATHGLMVNGLATSPYGIAVGGTDFLNFGVNYTVTSVQQPSPYWNLSNDTNQASAKGYIPESTWNSTCTNNVFVVFNYGKTPEASCNNSQAANWVETVGGSGGKSNCTAPTGPNPSNCTGGYPKPSWQSAPGVPQDGARDIPDVSLFASSGFMSSAYIICEADQPQGHGSCGLTNPTYDFLAIGGTSASAPAFAGIMALVNQYTQSAGQGNANHVLYKLASSQTQTNANCNSSAIPASGCIFNDVTSGTIATPCAALSLNCTVSVGSDLYGVLSGYSAGTGYDLATGLGSVNATNLVHGWSKPGISTSTTLSLNSNKAVNITHGQSVPFSITVAPSAATGDVSLIGSPVSGSSVAMGSFLTLQNGAVSGSTASLAGGTSYQVKAHYAGDGTYAPSDSPPVTVTVASEPSTTLISIPVFDPTSGKETGDTPTSLVYGSPYIARVDVGDASAAVTFPMKPVCATAACPTGNVTLTDSVNGGPQTPLGTSGVFPLSNQGNAVYQAIQLSGGMHQLTASYGGDNSYGASTGNYILNVTPAPTQASLETPSGYVLVSSPVYLVTTAMSNLLLGVEPTGTFTFFDGNTPITGIAILSGQPGNGLVKAGLSGAITTTFLTSGIHQITGKYSGDANYAASSTLATSISVLYPTVAMETANSTSINFGSSVTVTATVTSSAKSPPMTGTFQFTSFNNIGGQVTPTLTNDASGNQVLTASVTTSLPNTNDIAVTYSGDSNYQSANASIFITVIQPDFSIGTAAPSLSINAGQSGSTQLTLTPLNNIPSSVALSCNGQPSGSTCSFNPAGPLSLSNGTASSTTVTITTLPPSSSVTTSFVAPRLHGFRPNFSNRFWIIGLVDALAILLISGFAGKRSHRLALRMGLAGFLCLLLGCGTGSSGGGGGVTLPSPTSVMLSTSAVKVPAGTNLMFTASVNSSSPATGAVTLFDGGAPLTSATVVNGTATFQLTYLAVGTHMINAQYGGDSRNQSSRTNGSINQVITGTTLVYFIASSTQISRTTQITVTIQ